MGDPTTLEPRVPVRDRDAAHGEAREGHRGRLSRRTAKVLTRVAIVLVLLGAWQLVSGRLIDEFFISRPSAIGSQLWEWLKTGYLVTQTGVTLKETLLGYAIGCAAGVAAGLVLGINRFIGETLDPLVTAVYSLPKIALAPLFILWFGIGIQMKIALVALIVFFFVFFNTYTGVKDVDRDLLDVARVMGAKGRHLTKKVIIPSAMPWIFAGMKLSVPQALIGAIVGEIIASNKGLGYVVAYTAGQFDTAGLFAALFTLMVISVVMNTVLMWSSGRTLRWKTPNQ